MGGSSKKVTVGYKYYVGMHMALCHGPVDKLLRIRVGGKAAWCGENTGGPLTINKPDLFGGEKREGGISGQVDIQMGAPAQGQNSYLAAKLGSSLLPAFRGVCCAVMRQVYIGLNPYLKDWGWLLQRVYVKSNGERQWYPSKASIGQATFTYEGEPYSSLQAFLESWSAQTGFPVPQYVDRRVDATDGAVNWTEIMAAKYNKIYNPVETQATVYYIYHWRGNETGIYYDKGMEETIDDQEALDKLFGHGLMLNQTFLIRSILQNLEIALILPSSDPAPAAPSGFSWRDDWGVLSHAIYGPVRMWRCNVMNVEAVATTSTECNIATNDMNPAHIIRECLTDSTWGMGYPEADIDEASFKAAADTLHAEGMGISILWSQQTSIEDFVEEIIRHIDAALYVDRTTGAFVLKLIRGGYDDAALLVLDQSNISRVEGYTKQTMAELANEITVSYLSGSSGQVETITLQNLALIQQQGAIIPSSVEYMGFSREDITLKVAARDLKAVSSPLVTATLYSNRDAAGLNIGDVFRWIWLETDEDGAGVATSYVMRVAEIAFGDGVDNTVRIQAVQDVFSLPDITYVEAEPTEWEDPSLPPQPATPRLVVEAPYYELVRQLGEVDAAAKLSGLPELGILMVAAGRPAAEINAELQVDSGAGYVESGTLDFCPSAKLDGAIGYLDTSATLKDMIDIDDFVAGTMAQVDSEIVVVESITDGVATIRRGCLDTLPALHADGAVVVFWGGYTVSDEVEYVASDEVDVKLLTVTGGGMLAIADAPVDSVTMNQRAIRPYPPADIKIDGNYYPVGVSGATSVIVSWVHRDRTQQTGGTVLGFTDATVGPETGTTYAVKLYGFPSNVLFYEFSGITANSHEIDLTGFAEEFMRVELWSVRDGFTSMQTYAFITKNYSFAGGYTRPAYDAAGATFVGAPSYTRPAYNDADATWVI